MPNLKSALLKLKDEALSKLHHAKDKEELNLLKASYLGKKGELKVLSSLGQIPGDERADLGKVANDVRDCLLSELEL